MQVRPSHRLPLETAISSKTYAELSFTVSLVATFLKEVRMKTRLVYVCLMLGFVMLAVVTVPQDAVAGCSGDACGCYIDSAICRAACPPVGDPYRNSCMSECRQEEIACAAACCA